jgi:putative acetyltransferase
VTSNGIIVRRAQARFLLAPFFGTMEAVKYPPLRIRAFEPADAPRVCEIFYRSIHEVAKSKYDEAQLDAWAPKVPDASKWLPIPAGFDTYLAIDEAGEAIAWIAMTPTGYIDVLFCLPEALGRGIAGQLYETVERLATERGLSRITAHASLLAQPFFAKHGWRVEKHEMHVRNGVGISRAEMSKELQP